MLYEEILGDDVTLNDTEAENLVRFLESDPIVGTVKFMPHETDDGIVILAPVGQNYNKVQLLGHIARAYLAGWRDNNESRGG